MGRRAISKYSPPFLRLLLYILHEVFGTGSLATVYRATHLPSDTHFFVKRISTATRRTQTSSQLATELRVKTSIRHPGLMSAREVFHEKDSVAVVMGLMPGGSLKEDVCAQAPCCAQEIYAADIALQVLRGLARLHARGIVHCDIKLENVLCADESLPAHGAKLGAFGFAIDMAETPANRCNFPVGTPVYVAPESARGEAYGEPVDIFAVGVMVYLMLSTVYPFKAKDDRATMKLVASAPKPTLTTRRLETSARLASDFSGPPYRQTPGKGCPRTARSCTSGSCRLARRRSPLPSVASRRARLSRERGTVREQQRARDSYPRHGRSFL